MKDKRREKGRTSAPHAPRLIHPSSFPPSSFSYAAIALPPGMFVVTGVAAGPLWSRGLRQKAVIQTFDPGGTVAAKRMSMVVRVGSPSNFQSASSVGAVAPTKLKTAAPATPRGLPRLVGSPARCRRILTVLPTLETMSMSGAVAGGGIGGGRLSRGVRPRAFLFPPRPPGVPRTPP